MKGVLSPKSLFLRIRKDIEYFGVTLKRALQFSLGNFQIEYGNSQLEFDQFQLGKTYFVTVFL